MDVSKLKAGDRVLVEFGYEIKEHTVVKVVGDIVQVTPKSLCLGFWIPAIRIIACSFVAPEVYVETKEIERGFFYNLFH